MTESRPLSLVTSKPLDRTALAPLPFGEFETVLIEGVRRGERVVALFATPAEASLRLYLLLANDSTSQLAVASTDVDSERFPSLTPECSQVHLFEREIAEQYGCRPDGHPWLKPVRFAPSLSLHRHAEQELGLPGVTDFYQVASAEVHEVGVGPVHAGVIEPGHFRFQCMARMSSTSR
jgi:hypothetical protein